MPSTATARRSTEVSRRIAELETQLSEQLVATTDIDIRATLSADGLAVEQWSCDTFVIDDTPIEPRQSATDSLRMAREALEQCGQLLLDADPDCLPACLTKSLVEHADDPAAAWVAASMRMQAAYPEHGLVIERSGEAAFYFPAVAKSIAMLKVIGQHLRDGSGLSRDAGKATKRGSGEAPAFAEADAPLLASQLTGDKLFELLQLLERAIRQAARDQACRDHRGGDAEAEANEAARELRSLSGGEMVRRLISDRYIDASAAGDEALRKRVEDVMRRRLNWPKPSRQKRSSASAGAVAELAGKAQLSRPMALYGDTSAVDWCRNCYFTPRESGEEFCAGCRKRHSASHLDAILAGEINAEGSKLSPEVLQQARQQSLDRRRDVAQHKIAAAARRH